MSYAQSSPWNIRVRLTFLYLFIFGTTLVLFCSLLFRNFTNAQRNEFDIALYNHAVDISKGITLDFYGNLAVSPDILSPGGKIFPFSAGRVFIQILTIDGTEIARSRNLGRVHLPFRREELPLLFQNRGVFQTFTAQELHLPEIPDPQFSFRLLTAIAPGQAGRDFILQVAVPEELLTPVIQELKQFLWFGIPATLFIAMLAGFYLSRKALAPVSEMIEKANHLSPYRLSERIPVPQTEDEIQALALTLNALLERLQKAFESQERFIADASHELKTPLAILRGELDVFRSRPRTEEEVSTLIESAAHELATLSRIVEDLLTLARVDAGIEATSKSFVQFEEIVFEVVSKLEVLAKQKEIKVRLMLAEASPNQDNPYLMQGDSDLLRILIKNLVENGIKYSPAGQAVEVSLEARPDTVYFQVSNGGPGIPPESLPKIFERFYRGTSPSSGGPQGAGLGLAIAQRIAEVHGGKVQAESTPQVRTTFSVSIKRGKLS